MATTGIIASAAQGRTVSGVSGNGTEYKGYVEGGINALSCWGATHTTRVGGDEDVRAYVEIVNANGYRIGSGQAGTGASSAYSGTITQRGGENAYGSCGTASGSGSTFTRLY
ncbi:hypothetical protein D3C81_1780520 [compost metagenome]